MCKYVIVITIIVRQDVDGHFGTTLNLPDSNARGPSENPVASALALHLMPLSPSASSSDGDELQLSLGRLVRGVFLLLRRTAHQTLQHRIPNPCCSLGGRPTSVLMCTGERHSPEG